VDGLRLGGVVDADFVSAGATSPWSSCRRRSTCPPSCSPPLAELLPGPHPVVRAGNDGAGCGWRDRVGGSEDSSLTGRRPADGAWWSPGVHGRRLAL